MNVWECALGFMDAQVLLTAEKMGVFDSLSGQGRSAADVAADTGIPEDSARRLLTALCALDLVEKAEDGRFVNSPEASEKLIPGKPGYIGNMFAHVRDDLYPLWHHFEEALREGGAQWGRISDGATPRNEELYEDPERLRAFMEGMHTISYKAATQFAPHARELEEIEHIVDVGGASGAFLIALAEEFSGLRGTIFDLPPVQPIAEDYVARHELGDRIAFHAGDFWEEPLPENADAYSLGFILHDWDTSGGTHLLCKVADAIRPGGLLIIGEYLLNDEKTGPLHVARQDLNMLVAARGRERSAREYRAWIEAFGFRLERIQPTVHGKHFLLARKQAV